MIPQLSLPLPPEETFASFEFNTLAALWVLGWEFDETTWGWPPR